MSKAQLNEEERQNKAYKTSQSGLTIDGLLIDSIEKVGTSDDAEQKQKSINNNDTKESLISEEKYNQLVKLLFEFLKNNDANKK